MDGGKSLYVIRFYGLWECNYLVRKVSKRTSRDFLWAIDKVFTLSAFTNVGVKLPCKKSKQKDVKRFPTDGGKSLYVIRIAHSGKEFRLKCVHYKKKSRTVLTDDAAFACKYIARA